MEFTLTKEESPVTEEETPVLSSAGAGIGEAKESEKRKRNSAEKKISRSKAMLNIQVVHERIVAVLERVNKIALMVGFFNCVAVSLKCSNDTREVGLI